MARKSNQFDADEMYRQLRTNIEFSNVDEKVKAVNFISTLPNEGKTTLAIHLARVSADQYGKVLLIDCDLRNPSCHRRLNISKGEGLSNFLAKSEESILSTNLIREIEANNEKKFYFLSAGSRVPNPLEVLSSQSFKHFLEDMKKEFDFIVLDCPPISLCSDGIPLSNVADGTLYVISGKDADKRIAKSFMNELTRNGANIIGLCLTKMDLLSKARYKYYGYGYGYGYGKQNKEEDD